MNILKLALASLIVLSLSGVSRAQATSTLKWDDPKLALHVPQDVLQQFRNPDGCLAPESLVSTDKGLVRIDSLDPIEHAVRFHAKDGKLKYTNNYLVFPSRKADRLTDVSCMISSKDWKRIPIRTTPEHRLAFTTWTDNHKFGDMKQYAWATAESYGNPIEKLETPIDVWDIAIGEPCFQDEGNFVAGGFLVHNSCVQCSNGMTGTDQGVPEFEYLLWDSPYGRAVRGGSDPSRVASYAKARNVRIYNVTGKQTWEWMKWACDPARGARGAAIGAGSVHFQTLVGFDPKTSIWYVVNNNGDQRIQEYSDEAFRRLHLASGQWCVILDYPPAPAPAEPIEWWRHRTPEPHEYAADDFASNTP